MAPERLSTCSASPARSRPWSTKTQVSWSPIALCTSAAATEESTPPDRAHSTGRSPTVARTSATTCSMTPTRVHVGRAPQTSMRNRLRISWPRGVCRTSGWNWTPNIPRDGSSMAATVESAVAAVTRKPSGALLTASWWLIHTDWVAGIPSSRVPPPLTRSSPAGPNSAMSPAATSPPRAIAIS